MGDSEIICYVREDGKVILWEEDSPEAWWVLDPDIVMTDNDALTGPQTSLDDWRDGDE